MLDDDHGQPLNDHREILRKELAVVQERILHETRKELGAICGSLTGWNLAGENTGIKDFPTPNLNEFGVPSHKKAEDEEGSKAGDANAGDDNCDVKSSASSAASAKKCSSSPNTVAKDISKVVDDHLMKSRQQPVKTRLQSFVRSQSFEMFFAMVVILNAVVAGFRADAGPNERSVFLDVIELLIALLFVVELFFRFSASGSHYFKHCAGFWNILDALLIIFMLADAVCAVAGVFMFGIDDGGLMRLYRVLRLARVARMARLFHLVPELHFTLSLMLQSMSSFFWAAVLMMIIMHLVALYFTMVSGHFMGSTGDIAQIQAYWGSTRASMNSLFLAVFGGEDWHDMLLVFGPSNAWYVVNSMVLSLFVGFVLVVILNLVNGVLVEGAQVMIADQKRDELVRMAADIFVQTGKKAGDELSKEEFDDLLHSEAMTRYLDAIEIEMGDADQLFEFLDRDDSGSLSIVEFIQGCLRLRGPAKALDLAAMHLWSKEQSVDLQGRLDSLQRQLDELSDMLRTPRSMWLRTPRSPGSPDSSLPLIEEDSPPDLVPHASPNILFLLQAVDSPG